MPGIKKQQVMWEELNALGITRGGGGAGPHTHLKADITDTPWLWDDVSKAGSNLTDLATRQHSGLTDITSDQHHPKLHASEHEVGGGDLVDFASLTGFGTYLDQAVKQASNVNFGTLSCGYLTVTDSDETIRLVGGGSGDANKTWIAFYDSNGITRRGYVGDASGFNDDIYLASDTGDIRLVSGGGKVLVLGNLSISSVVNAAADTDKFLVLDASGNVDFRTGVQVRSDIGASASGHLHDDSYYTKSQINTYLEEQDELSEMQDVNISTPTNNQLLVYNLTQAEWQNAGIPTHGHDHDNLTNVTEDQHHSEIHAVTHKAVGADAIRIDELKIATDVTTLNSTTSQHGLLPKLYGGSVRFLRADGIWATLPDAEWHATTHEVGGDDLVSHDDLTDFVGAEHLSLPNTIANVLTDHNLAEHDGLGIDHGSLSGRADDDHSQYHNDTRGDTRYYTKSQINTYLEEQDELSEMSDVNIISPADAQVLAYNLSQAEWQNVNMPPHSHDHDNLTNVTDDQHHSEIHAVTHKSAGGDAIRIDELKEGTDVATLNSTTLRHGLLRKLYGGTTRFLRGDGTWQITPGGTPDPHASDHELGGSDEVDHDSLLGFVAGEHFLQSAITVVGTIVTGVWEGTDVDWAYVSKTGSNLTHLATRQHAGLTDVTANQHHPQSHTLVSHTARDHHNLIGLGDDDHSQYYNSTRHTKAIHDALNIDADTLDSISSGGFLRSNVDDNLTAAIIVPTASRDEGIFGTYDSAKTQHIWSMGTGYRNSPTGADFGNLYGLAYKYNGVAGGHGVYLVSNGAEQCALGLNVWTRGRFISTLVTGTAPLTVASTTKVTNLNADRLDGYHASSAAGNNTIVLRTASGYIYCNFLNTTSSPTTSEPTHYFVETGNDSFLRQMTPANFVSKLAADGLMPKSGGAFSGLVEARNHGTGTVDEVVNVCYGTSDTPPAVGTVTEGTIYIKYTA